MNNTSKHIINISIAIPPLLGAIYLLFAGYPFYVSLKNLGWATYSVAGGLLGVSIAMIYITFKRDIDFQGHDLSAFRRKVLAIRKNSTLVIRIILAIMALMSCAVFTGQNIELYNANPDEFLNSTLALQLFMGIHAAWLFRKWAITSLDKYAAMLSGDDSHDGPPPAPTKGLREYFNDREISRSFLIAAVLLVLVFAAIIMQGYPIMLGLVNFGWIIIPLSTWYLAALFVYFRQSMAGIRDGISINSVIRIIASLLIMLVVLYNIWLTLICNIMIYNAL